MKLSPEAQGLLMYAGCWIVPIGVFVGGMAVIAYREKKRQMKDFMNSNMNQMKQKQM